MDLPRRRRSWVDRLSTPVLVLLIVFALALLVGWTLLLGWVLQAVLHGFGVEAAYWPCVGAIVLAELLLGGGSRS